jgi:hypothetical protein
MALANTISIQQLQAARHRRPLPTQLRLAPFNGGGERRHPLPEVPLVRSGAGARVGHDQGWTARLRSRVVRR